MSLLLEGGRPCLDHVVRMLVEMTVGAVRVIAGPGASAEELASVCSAHAVRLVAEQDRENGERHAS